MKHKYAANLKPGDRISAGSLNSVRPLKGFLTVVGVERSAFSATMYVQTEDGGLFILRSEHLVRMESEK